MVIVFTVHKSVSAVAQPGSALFSRNSTFGPGVHFSCLLVYDVSRNALHDFLTLHYHVMGTFVFPGFLCVLNLIEIKLCSRLEKRLHGSMKCREAVPQETADASLTMHPCSSAVLCSSCHQCARALPISETFILAALCEPRAGLHVLMITLVLPALSLLLPMISSWRDSRCAVHWNPTPGHHRPGISVDFAVSSHTLSTYYSATLSYMFLMGTYLIFIIFQHVGIELDNYYILFFFAPFVFWNQVSLYISGWPGICYID